MIPISNIDQRERKIRQGQAAAFYSAAGRQMQPAHSPMQQMPARGMLG